MTESSRLPRGVKVIIGFHVFSFVIWFIGQSGAVVAYDTVAAWGTMRHLAPGRDFTTVELKANVFSAAREGDTLDAEGELLHTGRRTQVWEVRIRKGDRLGANFVCTQLIIAP